jgi:tripartite-type tricarboxylate transporter receptor subunit TctC
MPDLPTVAETLPGFEVNSWHCLSDRAGPAPAIVRRVWTEVSAIMQQPELREALVRQGLNPEANGPGDFAAILRQDTQRWTEMVRAIGVPQK